MTEQQPDPLVRGIRSAALHLGKAGFEVFAALGAVATGITQKVRPDDSKDTDRGPEHVPVD
jgi:hypothetical protein